MGLSENHVDFRYLLVIPGSFTGIVYLKEGFYVWVKLIQTLIGDPSRPGDLSQTKASVTLIEG